MTKKTENNPVKKGSFTEENDIQDRSFLNTQNSENGQSLIICGFEENDLIFDGVAAELEGSK